MIHQVPHQLLEPCAKSDNFQAFWSKVRLLPCRRLLRDAGRGLRQGDDLDSTSFNWDFTAQHPGVTLTPNYNGSDTLAAQITQGGPADVFASADTANMDKLTSAGLVPTATVHIFARNKLQIIVAKGNPKGIKTLADLARPGVAVVLENPGVPAGKYAAQALATAGVTVTAKSLETSVTAVVQKVALGEADAGIVYVTDVAAAVAQHEPVEGVDIPTPPNVVATYPIGIVKTAPNPPLAQAFEDYVLSPPGRADLASFGFLPPS